MIFYKHKSHLQVDKGLFIYYVIRVGGRGGSANCLLHITEGGVGGGGVINYYAL